MKATATEDSPPATFAPVVLELRLETQAEVDAIYSVFNNRHVLDAVAALVPNPSHSSSSMGFAVRSALRIAQPLVSGDPGYLAFYNALRDGFFRDFQTGSKPSLSAGTTPSLSAGATPYRATPFSDVPKPRAY